MISRRLVDLLCVLAVLVLLASGNGRTARYPLTVADCRGKKVTIRAQPNRIVSTAPSNTEILYALGLDSRIVGVTGWCDYPPQAKKKPKVGDRIISTEKVISLKPDLVLAHGYLNAQAIRSMEAHGIKVFAIDPKTIDQVARDIRLVGRITNRERAAQRVALKLSSTAANVKKKTASLKSRPKVLVAVQGDPLWAAGPNTFVDEIITLSGGRNLMADAKPGFNQVSAEAAVFRNPEIIVVTTRSELPILTRGVWAKTSASRNRRVYAADPNLLVRPGPRLAEGITIMARLVHPELFDPPSSKADSRPNAPQ